MNFRELLSEIATSQLGSFAIIVALFIIAIMFAYLIFYLFKKIINKLL